ncbi:MAG: glycoside hydrolase family 97 N-terminal domain-containing protein, partial [Alistipes sp.]|nr:glycoside hydrolase family 97 N-terminal domain-containing protein [Alistipes sp.]
MKRLIFLAACLLSGIAAPAQELSSPDGRLTMRFALDEGGVPRYELAYNGTDVIAPSRLGLRLRDDGKPAEFCGSATAADPSQGLESLYA